MIFRFNDYRQKQPLGAGLGEAGVAVLIPLHRGTYSVAVAQIIIVTHADLVAVVDDGSARHGEEQHIHQLDLSAVVFHQWCQPAADAEVDTSARVSGIDPVHIVTLLIGHHLQGQFIMVAQEDGPLAPLRDGRRLIEDIDDRKTVFHLNGHEHARHERKVESHVAFVSGTKIGGCILRPLVGL